MAFALVTSLFFLWAFVHNLEPILIPHLKKACQLTDLQSALIDSAVYLGYFLMAVPAGLIMKKYGYKQGILAGLALYALGALLFVPAANTRMYLLFLGALFIIASGCAFLETAANPYVTILGPANTATTRLNLSQSFNGLGAFLAPLIGGKFILSGIEHSEAELAAMTPAQLDGYLQFEADSVKLPYIIIAIVVLAVLGLFVITRMPDVQNREAGNTASLRTALRHKHLVAGIWAQFFYVGAQVCVTSFFIRFAKYTSNVPEKQAADWLGYAMLGFLIGRFVGTFLTSFIPANRLLTLYSLISMALLGVAMTVESELAVWAVFAVPFFQSIMFPTIFALGIDRLEEDRELGSSLLVMAIAGGALFPLLMGWISDQSNIQLAYIIPLLCFSVVAWFGWRGYK
ncbi:L-fucose:H+ symporter permease [Rudanella paleaurantiibacter]|uniref:L-fucose:H+ symporter permease n=1 Tax=Rudanella paleaurantiibacter TaxID=2614655 RepID=A0A7J5U1I7_9BACT|nr:L-fucose:H+ symporter permease [Rudanella paleaurantiibacter]